jgi:hypothetical protein
LTTASDGKRYRTTYYNLDVIISAGYRVKSKRGTQFRIWATRVLKEFLLRGYAFNQRIERIEKFAIETAQRLTEAEKKIEFLIELKKYIEDILADYNDINEDTRRKLEFINQALSVSNVQFGEIYQALTELAEHKKELDKPRKPIGFIQNKDTQ